MIFIRWKELDVMRVVWYLCFFVCCSSWLAPPCAVVMSYSVRQASTALCWAIWVPSCLVCNLRMMTYAMIAMFVLLARWCCWWRALVFILWKFLHSFTEFIWKKNVVRCVTSAAQRLWSLSNALIFYTQKKLKKIKGLEHIPKKTNCILIKNNLWAPAGKCSFGRTN